MAANGAPLRFVCLRYGTMLRLHMYTGGGTLMSSLQSTDPRELKRLAVAWLVQRSLRFEERDLDAAIGRAEQAAAT